VSARRLRRRRLIVGAGASFALLVLPLALHVGVLSTPQPWGVATGWNRVPSAERPADSRLWKATPGHEPPELWWLGHSGFLLRWHGRQLLVDPNTSSRCTVSARVLEPAAAVATLGPIDAVLLSHAHFDHMDVPTLTALPDVRLVALPAGAERWLPPSLLAHAGLAPLHAGERVSVGDLEICAVPAAHEGNRTHPFHGAVGALGWVVRHGPDAIYFAGDTAATNPFVDIAREHRPRVAVLPIGAWLPRFPMKHYHLSPEEAVVAGEKLGVETIVPCHFGTFTLSLDRPSWALPRFAHAARVADVHWVMPRLLTPAVAETQLGDREVARAGGPT